MLKNLLIVGLAIFGLVGVGAIALTNINIKAIAPTSSQSEFTIKNPQLEDLNRQWIVSGSQAKKLLIEGATLIDARPVKLFKRQPLLGAVSVSWQEFSQSKLPFKGNLIDDDKILTEKLQAIGIFQEKPVIVVGDPVNGWGEDGRIVWMLRSLGHQKAVLVDGGFSALVNAGLPTVKADNNPVPPKGNFVVQRRKDWQISREELRGNLGRDNVAIIDAREPREYAGQTPYGESRGGHIPGAINVYYQDWLGEDGRLLSRWEILEMLSEMGVKREAIIVTYCTGGVRSGWSTVVLADLGFAVKNYPGSMWEWSAGDVDVYPLEK